MKIVSSIIQRSNLVVIVVVGTPTVRLIEINHVQIITIYTHAHSRAYTVIPYGGVGAGEKKLLSFIITQFTRDRCIQVFILLYIFFSTNNINFLRAIWVPGALIQFTAGARQLYGGSSSCGIVNPIIHIMMIEPRVIYPLALLCMCGRQQKPHAASVTDRQEGPSGMGGTAVMRRRRRNIKGNEKKSYK